MPHLTEGMGQARVKGTGMLAAKRATVDERVAISAIAERAKERLDNVAAQIAKAQASDPGLKDKLAAAAADAATQAQSAFELT
jgi:hypothetical protein